MNKMKNIYLFDSSLRLLKAIERGGNVNISLLATQARYYLDGDEIKKNNPFLENTYFIPNSFEVELPFNNIALNYDLIEKFRSTQLKVEQYLTRLNLKPYEIQYIYFKTLSFFYECFLNKEIDAVITVLPLHGSPLEIIPIDLAIHFKKPAYTFDILYRNLDGFSLWGIWDYKMKRYIDISQLGILPDLDNYLFYKSHRLKTEKGASLYCAKTSGLSKLQKVLYVIKNLIKKNNKEKRSTINSLMGLYPKFGFGYLWMTERSIRNSYKDLKKTQKYYNSLCESSVDLSINYVYYPLHVDPEASTLVREVLSNQLTIIKMLNDNLPNGWKVIVKEHPALFNLLNPKKLKESWYFLFSQNQYRSKSFYKTISELNNTILVNLCFSSEELVKKAKIVATINGTVSLEAAVSNKPILLFGDKLPLVYLKDVFHIDSNEKLKSALVKVSKGYVPNYLIDEIKKYLFEMNVNVNASNSVLFEINSEMNNKLSDIIDHLLTNKIIENS